MTIKQLNTENTYQPQASQCKKSNKFLFSLFPFMGFIGCLKRLKPLIILPYRSPPSFKFGHLNFPDIKYSSAWLGETVNWPNWVPYRVTATSIVKRQLSVAPSDSDDWGHATDVATGMFTCKCSQSSHLDVGDGSWMSC